MCTHAYYHYDSCGHHEITLLTYCYPKLFLAGLSGRLEPCQEFIFLKVFYDSGAKMDWDGLRGYCRHCQREYGLDMAVLHSSSYDNICDYSASELGNMVDSIFVYLPSLNTTVVDLLGLRCQYRHVEYYTNLLGSFPTLKTTISHSFTPVIFETYNERYIRPNSVDSLLPDPYPRYSLPDSAPTLPSMSAKAFKSRQRSGLEFPPSHAEQESFSPEQALDQHILNGALPQVNAGSCSLSPQLSSTSFLDLCRTKTQAPYKPADGMPDTYASMDSAFHDQWVRHGNWIVEALDPSDTSGTLKDPALKYKILERMLEPVSEFNKRNGMSTLDLEDVAKAGMKGRALEMYWTDFEPRGMPLDMFKEQLTTIQESIASTGTKVHAVG